MIKKIQEKWIRRWQKSKIFESNPDKRKKFFGTIPYPYVNSYLHLGFFYTSIRYEALARFKRMQGFNVLYAQSWHCTGSPIINAANRIKKKEPKQIEIMKMQGFSNTQIKKFEDPVAWVKYFPKHAKKDMQDMGFSVDLRREFITTNLNPHYDAFIKWQFRKLKKKGYVLKGKFPVVWDPVENTPVGDHARIEGEGETPQEYVLIKHKLGEKWVVSATLRPDTIMGVTNLYVNPESDLVEATVDDQTWIISEKTANELKYQDKKVKVLRKIKGLDLIGKRVEEFDGNHILILPATFVSTNVGTGIVHSVPSDSADDLIALYDLQKDVKTCDKYGLDIKEVRNIKPIAVIKIPGYGKIPADDVLKKLNIRSQKEYDKLKKAKDLLYKDGFYKGKLNELYKFSKFSRDYSGKQVTDAKELIKEDLVKSEFGDIYYQLTGRVIARTLGECLVKIVDDQWFLAYGDEKWTRLAHKCLDKMKLYPEKTRTQFNYVLDWLRNWACTREFGLGTKLPWDENWIIESLSDSTIYMAFYTIYYKIKDINPKKLDDNFFDYVFLHKNMKIKVDKKIADKLRKEFEYWYPMDFRNTGKDLIQNHMSFAIFNHVAIFPEKHWPVSYGLNGHVMVDGDKMSKSKGNFITMRKAFKDYGADASRFTALSGGEGIDDANFDTELARTMNSRLMKLLEFAKLHYNKGRYKRLQIDDWLENKINLLIKETTRFYDETLFRSALQSSYFEMQNALKWYLRRCSNNPHKDTINRFIETQTLLMAPIIPYTCEEIWEIIGKKGFISIAEWPVAGKVLKELDAVEETVQTTLEDIHSVLKLTKIKPKKIILFIAEKWKYDLYKILKKEKVRDFSKIMAKAMKNSEFKKHSKDVVKIIQKSLKQSIDYMVKRDIELLALEESKDFFATEFKADIQVIKAENSKEGKARQALPGKVAILVE